MKPRPSRSAASLLALGLLLGLASCAGASRSQKVQEAAYELNMGTRFGRMPLEKVAASSRTKFLEQHRPWQGAIRIVDVDMAGMNVPKSGDATVFVAVGWQRADEQDMRSSVVAQKWREERGGWMLAEESVADGDPTIFEGKRADASSTARTPASRYQTTTIRE
jgi:hypothetical protein